MAKHINCLSASAIILKTTAAVSNAVAEYGVVVEQLLNNIEWMLIFVYIFL